MRSVIIGTAGHIDHGKSALVRALTGTDPDRLKEEKERGITIDLGFAHLDLGDGLTASFIDVPGHERFVRNMLAGAHGIDAVLLVVAVDESVMPQTREHFHICRLLGIPRGLVALTKCDLADAETLALVEMEIRELLSGSFLDGAPLHPVSARTGQGLTELVAALARLAREVPPRPEGGIMRFPIDRVFTLRGFGTVVTGTLVSGELHLGDDLEVLPSGKMTRVRGLQVHGETVERVPPGSRSAVNLASLEVDDLARGDVMVHPGTLRSTSMLDVEISVLPGGRPLAHHERLRVHLASAEVLARARLFGDSAIAPGDRGLGQLRLERPAVAGRADRLVLRSYSPVATIGGAMVLDPLPPKRRAREVDRDALRRRARATPVGAAVAMIDEAGIAGVDLATLAARVTLPAASLADALTSRTDIIALGTPPSFLSVGALGALAGSVRSTLDRFHRENPLRASMPREELRKRVFARAPAGALERVLADRSSDELRVTADSVALAGHGVRMTPQESAARSALLDAVENAGLTGLDLAGASEATRLEAQLLDRAARVLLDEGSLARVGEGILVHRKHLEALKRDVRRVWPPGSRLEVGGFKELTGLSRKYVIPLLEFLDRERVTRRSGQDRIVLSGGRPNPTEARSTR